MTFQVLQMPNSKSLTFLQQNTGEFSRTQASEISFPVQSDPCSIRNTVISQLQAALSYKLLCRLQRGPMYNKVAK